MRILCIDFDDVIYNSKPIIEQLLEKIEPLATEKHLINILNKYSNYMGENNKNSGIDPETLDNMRREQDEHFDYKDRVLEEVDEKYRGLIDYDAIFSNCDVFPGNIEYINYLINNTYYDKVYVLSHCNVKREEEAKRKFLNKFFPGLELIPVPFHKEKYQKNLKRGITSKAKFFMEYKGISDLSNCTLVDDSNKNCVDWQKNGGIAIQYKNGTETVKLNSMETNTLNPLLIESFTAESEYQSGRRK